MGPIRQRKALSCVDCRRRKVKCDRTVPICIRCQKGGNADKCTYVSVVGAGDTILTPSDDSPDQQRDEQVEDLDQLIAPFHRQDGYERAPPISKQPEIPSESGPKHAPTEKELLSRVMALETYVRSAGGKPSSHEFLFGIGNPIGPGYNAGRSSMSNYDKVMVRGQSFSTQYFGPSLSISLLLQFEELSRFVKNVLIMVPELSAAKSKMATVLDKTKKKPKTPVPHDSNTLIRMVPSREIADAFVEHYLKTFETTHRILHVPSFRDAYEAFWENPYESRPEFVAQLLLVISTVYCVVPGGAPGYVGRSSAAREVVTRWVTACESWVNEQSKKHMTMSHLQIHVLVFLARAMNCVKIKREWINAGTIIRLAMSAGLHREPSFLSQKISLFDCEMRRRLWFTIVELDLQTTINRGMAPSIDPFGWDCLAPRNIDDDEFDENTTVMPPSRPKDEFTRTSYLNGINDWLALRIDILCRLNSIRLGVDLETVMQYDNKLRKILDDLPSWTKKLPHASDSAENEGSGNSSRVNVARRKASKSGGTPNNNNNGGMSRLDVTINPSDLAAPLMQLMIYEYILVLHIPLASQTPNQARFIYTTASRRDAAIKCLRIYSCMPAVNRLHFSNSRDDLHRAALTMCHDLATNREEDLDPIVNTSAVLELILCIVDVLEHRVRNLGQGFHGFWITCTGYSLCQWKLSGEESAERYAKQAAGRVITLFERSLLSEQVPLPALDGMPTGRGGYASGLSGSSSLTSPSNTTMQARTPGAPQSVTTDDMFASFDAHSGTAMAGQMDPMWDFMNFDFGSVWNLPMDGYSYPDQGGF